MDELRKDVKDVLLGQVEMKTAQKHNVEWQDKHEVSNEKSFKHMDECIHEHHDVLKDEVDDLKADVKGIRALLYKVAGGLALLGFIFNNPDLVKRLLGQ